MATFTRAQLVQAAREAAQRHGLRTGLFVRQIKAESNFNPGAQSGARAGGIAQIMPGTARAWHVNAADPIAALDAAAAHMAQYVKKYGEEGALRAYNAGEGAIEKSKSYGETNAYVSKILDGLSPVGKKSKDRSGATETAKTMLIPGGTKQDIDGALLDMLASHKSGSKLKQLDALLSTGQYDTATPDHTITTAGPSNKADHPPGQIEELVSRANAIDSKRMPYLWGGGHGGKVDAYHASPLDCSGAVSAVLGIDPRVSGEFAKWGSPGEGSGKGVVIYSNPNHVLMKINGHFFGTSSSNPGGGAGWIPQGQIPKDYLRGFTARHAASLG